MTPSRFREITSNYSALKIGVVGDFCLDRYLEIDPAKPERSIETGLAVHNVTNVRSHPGGAGTVLNNLCALGIGKIYPVGFCGEDGEGFELRRALANLKQISTEYFFASSLRRTFTYTKPLVVQPGRPPRELNRLDLKNWTPTPAALETKLTRAVAALARKVDALIVLDQVDYAQTGVVTRRVLKMIERAGSKRLKLIILADSRRGLRNFPPFIYKMNRAELGSYLGSLSKLSVAQTQTAAVTLARKIKRPVIITMAERGIMAASPTGELAQVPAFPLRGEIDIVGAGDVVTANIVSALVSGASLREALELAMAAASVVIHKLGTTGTASTVEIKRLLFSGRGKE